MIIDKKYLIVIVLLISFVTFSASAQKIYTTDTSLKLIIKEICGASIAVETIQSQIDSTSKKFKLNPKILLNLSYAKAIVYNSDVVDSWMQNVPSSNKINMNDLLDSVVTGGVGVDSINNQYFYLNPKLLAQVVPKIANRLSEIDSANREKYESNAEMFTQKLELLDLLVINALKGAKNKRIATLNSDLAHYAKVYNILMIRKGRNSIQQFKKSMEVSNIFSVLATKFPIDAKDQDFVEKADRMVSNIYLNGLDTKQKEYRNFNDFILGITNRLLYFMK